MHKRIRHTENRTPNRCPRLKPNASTREHVNTKVTTPVVGSGIWPCFPMDNTFKVSAFAVGKFTSEWATSWPKEVGPNETMANTYYPGE